MRHTACMNSGWLFHRGDIAHRNHDGIHEDRYPAAEWMKAGNMGLAKPGYPDADWQAVDLPHDFVVEANFSADADPTHGSLPTDVGWYRKTFMLSADDQHRQHWLEFDGVYRDCQVWMNGHFVGRHLSGYTSFQFDITDLCLFDQPNTVAVRADAREPELWSYEGGGIYRDVRLVTAHPVHIEPQGTWVRTEQSDADQTNARSVVVQTVLRNTTSNTATGQVCLEVFDDKDRPVTSVQHVFDVAADTTNETHLRGAIIRPRLWSPDDPYLYRLVTTLRIEGQVVDHSEVFFGVRDFAFKAEQGFLLNGEPLKIKGVCNHQDHAGVGVAIPDALQEWRLHQLKEMGCNALRTSHNPPTPALLDMCDRIGLLVLDEARLVGSSSELLNQLSDLIKRDRNHACVFAWSIGNEEMAIQATSIGIRQMRRMQELCHKLDPTRSVTYAMNCNWLANAEIHNEAGFRLDVFGGNYVCLEPYNVDGVMYDRFHERYPDWPLLATETGGSTSIRGLYHVENENTQAHESAVWTNPKRKGLVSAYGETQTPWGYSIMQTWKDCAERPFLAGTFLWTGLDYRGETYPLNWPAVITGYGLMDLCGFPKDAFHYYRAWWRDEPKLHLFPHWNWSGRESEPIDVVCYSNVDEVELWVNGQSVGRESMPRYERLSWTIPYQPGHLLAIGYDEQGQELVRKTIETTSEVSTVRLAADRPRYQADGRDVAVVTVAGIDDQGRFVATADQAIGFEIKGSAKILGVGNGNPFSHEPDKANCRQLYHGLCQVLLQVNREAGPVQLRATSPGLRPAVLNLDVEAVDPSPWIASVSADQITSAQRSRTAIDNAL